MIALTAFGVEKKQIYVDRQLGKDFECVKYKRMSRK